MQVKQYLSFTVWPLMMTSLVLGGGRYPPELVPFAISVEKRKKRAQALNTARELQFPPGGLESAFPSARPTGTRPRTHKCGRTQSAGLSAPSELGTASRNPGTWERPRDQALANGVPHTRPAQPMGASPEPHPPFALHPRSPWGHNSGAQNDALDGL